MSVPETTGAASCKRQENGDVSTDITDRPLKKARFAWQVKGKYHLKNELIPDSSRSCDKSSLGHTPENSSSINKVQESEQKLKIGDYLLKQDLNTFDAVIGDAKNSHDPSTSIAEEKLQYPRYIRTSENKLASSTNSENRLASSTNSENRLDYDPWPLTMVISQSYAEDECIARWQARQISKGFVDNTINRILDSWMTSIVPEANHNQVFAMDIAEFINNLPEDNSVENEGILMAISAHGLQSHSSSSSNENSIVDTRPYCHSIKQDTYLSSLGSPFQSDDEITQEAKEKQLSNDKLFNNIKSSLPYGDDLNSSTFNSMTTTSQDTSSSSYQYINDNQCFENSNIEDKIDINLDEDCITNHYDFMDAAVSFAIQSKGLTSYGTGYG